MKSREKHPVKAKTAKTDRTIEKERENMEVVVTRKENRPPSIKMRLLVLIVTIIDEKYDFLLIFAGFLMRKISVKVVKKA